MTLVLNLGQCMIIGICLVYLLDLTLDTIKYPSTLQPFVIIGFNNCLLVVNAVCSVQDVGVCFGLEPVAYPMNNC